MFRFDLNEFVVAFFVELYEFYVDETIRLNFSSFVCFFFYCNDIININVVNLIQYFESDFQRIIDVTFSFLQQNRLDFNTSLFFIDDDQRDRYKFAI